MKNEQVNKTKLSKKDIMIIAATTLVVVVLGVFVFLRIPSRRNKNTSTPTITAPVSVTEKQLKLPEQWKIIAEDTGGVKIKLEKTSTDSVKPTIVVINSNKEKKENNKTYVDNLIKGLRDTIPVKITENRTTNSNDLYIRTIAMTYYSGNDLVAVQQEVRIKGTLLQTLTASHSGETTDKVLLTEIEFLFSQLREE